MRFRFLLWLGAGLMKRAGRKNAEFQKKIAGKKAVIQIATADGQLIRYFDFADGRVSSTAGGHEKPSCTVFFKDAAFGFSALLPWNKRLQVSGIQNGNIRVEGDFSLFLWFQSLALVILPGKKY